MAQSDSPSHRNRRGGGRGGNSRQRPHRDGDRPHRDRDRDRGSYRSGPRNRDRDRAPRVDHRDWEPVDRGRDIRRREAARPPSLWNRLLSILTFGKWGKKKPKPKPAPTAKSAPPEARGERRERPAPQEKERKRTPADPAAITGARLHVGNLSYDAAESDLTEIFSGFGKVKSVEVVRHRRTQRSKGFAFVEMMSAEEARRAVSELHGKDFMGRPMELGAARAPETRPAKD